MKAILTIIFSCALLVASAQDPVKWHFEITRDGGQSTLNLTATMEDGWHIYGLELESDMGPLPTVFEFSDQEVEWGELMVPEPLVKYDDMFMMNVSYYEEEVTFTRAILNPDVHMVRGSVDYMVCNDETCLPPKLVPFELSLSTVDN